MEQEAFTINADIVTDEGMLETIKKKKILTGEETEAKRGMMMEVVSNGKKMI